MIKSVSVDIHTDHRPGYDFAKWGVHPTSPLEQRTPRQITGMAPGGIAGLRLCGSHSTDPIARKTGIPARYHVSETPPCGRRRFFNDVGGQGFTPFAQGRLRETMNCHSQKIRPVLMDPVAKVLWDRFVCENKYMNHSNSALPGVAGANHATPSTHEQIAALAFSLHLKHGRPEGRAREDWLEAEQLLLRLPANPPASLPARHKDSTSGVSTRLIEHPHGRDERHSPDRREIRQMNTSRRPASRESQRPAE